MMRDGMEDARIGQTIDGRYRVLKRLAAGGMGVVYRAERVGLAKPVAIKFLHRSQAAVANRRERFDREAAAMSRLSHPNLVSIIDYGELDDTPYLVMEFHKGDSLRQVLERGRLPPPRAVDFARQLLAGLGSAHASGVVHRDLKPANVLITGKPGHELVKVLDFGVAKLLEGDGKPSELSVMAGSLLGTAEYMAPEQARCEVIDPRADIYAVGILLYEMLTGKRPFEAERDLAVLRMQVEDEPARPTVHVPTLSPALERAVLRALEKDRERRWPTAEEFAAALAATPEGRIEAPRRAIAAAPAIATEPVRRPPPVVAVAGRAAGGPRRWPRPGCTSRTTSATSTCGCRRGWPIASAGTTGPPPRRRRPAAMRTARESRRRRPRPTRPRPTRPRPTRPRPTGRRATGRSTRPPAGTPARPDPTPLPAPPGPVMLEAGMPREVLMRSLVAVFVVMAAAVGGARGAHAGDKRVSVGNLSAVVPAGWQGKVVEGSIALVPNGSAANENHDHGHAGDWQGGVHHGHARRDLGDAGEQDDGERPQDRAGGADPGRVRPGAVVRQAVGRRPDRVGRGRRPAPRRRPGHDRHPPRERRRVREARRRDRPDHRRHRGRPARPPPPTTTAATTHPRACRRRRASPAWARACPAPGRSSSATSTPASARRAARHIEAGWEVYVFLPDGRYSSRLHPEGLDNKTSPS